MAWEAAQGCATGALTPHWLKETSNRCHISPSAHPREVRSAASKSRWRRKMSIQQHQTTRCGFRIGYLPSRPCKRKEVREQFTDRKEEIALAAAARAGRRVARPRLRICQRLLQLPPGLFGRAERVYVRLHEPLVHAGMFRRLRLGGRNVSRELPQFVLT